MLSLQPRRWDSRGISSVSKKVTALEHTTGKNSGIKGAEREKLREGGCERKAGGEN